MSLHNTPKKPNSQRNAGKNNSEIQVIFPFWKNMGETLAVMLRRFRHEQGLDEKEKLTYAGRLDPMAEGIVPILAGEARFQKDRFLKKSKTYEVEILLGVGTDTGDMLGLPRQSEATAGLPTTQEITNALKTISQTVSLPYPNYSSIPVDGKPLFMHARAGNTVVLPIKKVTIYSLELLEIKELSLQKLIDQAVEIIQTVEGDFRQKEIIEQWATFADTTVSQVQVVKIRITVSSGTYMRAIAEKLGKLLKIPALAYRIIRIEVEGIK